MPNNQILALEAAKKNKSKLVIVLTAVIILACLSFAYYYYTKNINFSNSAEIKVNILEIKADRVGQITDLNIVNKQEINKNELIARYDTTADIADLALARTALQDIYYGREVDLSIFKQNKEQEILALEEKVILAQKEEKAAEKLVQDWSKEESRLLIEHRKPNNKNTNITKELEEATKNLQQAKDYFELKSTVRAKITAEINKLKQGSLSNNKMEVIAFLNQQIKTSEAKLANQNILAPSDAYVWEILVTDEAVVTYGMPIVKLVPKQKQSIWLLANFSNSAKAKSGGKCKITQKSTDLELEGAFGEISETFSKSYNIKVYFDNPENINLGGDYTVQILN